MDVFACISSRITMDIRVVIIVHIIIIVVMSYSQFRCIKAYT